MAAGVSLVFFFAFPAAAQDVSISFGQGANGGELTERVIQFIALLTVLSLAPSILTSFTRIVAVLSLLRTASAPPPRRRTR